MLKFRLQDGREVTFRTAQIEDIKNIMNLYNQVYKGHYTLPDVTDPKLIQKKIEDPNYFWPIAEIDGKVISSVIFVIDPLNKLGKVYAAVVLKEFRGQDIMRNLVKLGLERLTKKTRSCDLIYATTRTVSLAPQLVLEHLNFYPMGIFPNVRKVEAFETHGLEVYIREGTLDLRRRKPRIIPELAEFYKIVQDILKLESPEIVELPISDPRRMGDPLDFEIIENIDLVQKLYISLQNKDALDKVFFPFVEPNLLFKTHDDEVKFFVHFNKLDGHGMILGYRVGGVELKRALMWFSDFASRLGIRYIELLVNAFKPEIQRQALDARFLPNAYFPAMRLNSDGSREDYAIFSRSFEHLDFMEMHLSDTNRRFLDAFMKCWYEMLIRCQPDFDEEWRIG